MRRAFSSLLQMFSITVVIFGCGVGLQAQKSQKVLITGQVLIRDKPNGPTRPPKAPVRVNVSPDAVADWTHAQGKFSFVLDKPGNRTIGAHLDGYTLEQRARTMAKLDTPNTADPDPLNLVKNPPPTPTPKPARSGNESNFVLIVLVRDQTPNQEQPQQCSDSARKGKVSFEGTGVPNLKIGILLSDSKINRAVKRLNPVVTSDSGEYNFTLPDSNSSPDYDEYTILINDDRFEPLGLLMHRTECPPADIGLETRSVGDQYDVLLNRNEATRRSVFIPWLMQALPISGLRSFDGFAFLAPGVAPPPQSIGPSGPGISAGVGTAGQFAINGMRSRENNFTIDGSDNNDEDIGARRQGFVALTPQPIESVQELQVITLMADARFGRNIGGQINALTSSGGNHWHGSAFGWFTSNRLNARNFFDGSNGNQPAGFPLTRQSDGAAVTLDGVPLVRRNPVQGKDPFTRMQGGLTIGGSVGKSRHNSIFGSFEQVKINASKESHFSVPTVRERGLFDTGDTGLGSDFFPTTIPGDAIFSLFPFPNNPAGPYGQNTFTEVLPAGGHATRFSVKIEHEFNGHRKSNGPWWKAFYKRPVDGDQISGRYNFSDEASILPATGGALFSSLRPRIQTQNVAFFFNRTLSGTTTDTIRFSFGRASFAFQEVRDPFLSPSQILPDTPFLLNAPLLLNVTGRNSLGKLTPPAFISAGGPLAGNFGWGFPQFNLTEAEQLTGPIGQVVIPGFSPLGVEVNDFPQSRIDNTFQVGDTITHISRRGPIQIFGFDIRKSLINDSLEKNFRPLVVFNGLPSSVAGAPIKGIDLAAGGVPTGLFQTLAVNPDASIGIRYTQLSFFFQNDMSLGKGFRINLGLRYNFNNNPETADEKVEKAFDPQEILRQADAAAKNCDALQPFFIPAGRCRNLVAQLSSAFPADFKLSFASNRSVLDERFGFAWDLGEKGKAVLRGGIGTYSGQFPGVVIDQSRNAFPAFVPVNFAITPQRPGFIGEPLYFYNLANPAFTSSSTALNVVRPGTLNTLVPGVTPIDLLASRLYFPAAPVGPHVLGLDLVLPQRELRRPSGLQSGVTFEQQFKRDYLVSVSFVWTRGFQLLRVTTPDRGLNLSELRSPSVSTLDFLSPGSPLLRFPRLGGSVSFPQPSTSLISESFAIARTFFESSASSNYRALQIEVRKRYRKPFEFGSALTYSRSVDDASDIFDSAGTFALPQNSEQRDERGFSSFDMRWRSVSQFVFNVPGTQHKLTDGLQIAAIVTGQTGQPFTINSGIDVNRDGNLTDRLNTIDGLLFGSAGDPRTQVRLAPGTDPNSLLAADGQDGAIGRNTFRAPGLLTVDLSLSQSFNVSEHWRIIPRMEVFNLLNRTNFGVPVRILEAPAFGRSVGTTTSARTIQFNVKVVF